MAPKKDAERYALPHIRIEQFRRDQPYSPPGRSIQSTAPRRNNVTHSTSLKRQFSAAYARAKADIALRRSLRGQRFLGVYLEVTSAQNESLGDLSWESKGIRLGALQSKLGIQKATIFVPESSESFVGDRLDRYGAKVLPGKSPSLAEKFESIKSIVPGSARSLWTDIRPIPEDVDQEIWWECWTWNDKIAELESYATLLGLLVSKRRLIFPEVDVIPIYGSRAQIEDLIFGSGAIEQLRNATDSPSFFTVTMSREQDPWVDDLRGRVAGPPEDSPSVCLLDSGVAQAHPLIKIALSASDCLSVNPLWGTTDDTAGHGTKMAGTILYADLTYSLADQRTIEIPFRLESVKLLPPETFEPTDAENYGTITQAAVSTIEIHAPNRDRVFCMAVTNLDLSGERPTSWSAALDQIASGAMVGDRDEENTLGPRRLFLVSAGNIPDTSDPDEISDIEEYPVEDPAQAWNVITVGGFTEKTIIDPSDGYKDWTPVAEAGDISPYSRISTDWEHSRTPIKPEIVFEAGNKAFSPEKTEILSGLDSLSLLTTNRDFASQSLSTFWATSPATAQAAGMAGLLMAEFPHFWPETIRALMIHSAEWTPSMLVQLEEAPNKHQKVLLTRHFGYGVPSLSRALASAQNDLVLLAQQEITPFQRETIMLEDGSLRLKNASFKQIDYYDLPWPVNSLEELGEESVILKVTLSYFVEPSPNWDASLAPARYQSFGLRFDLKRAAESEQQFHERVNRLERDDGPRIAAVQDDGWTFGSQSVAAGSVHCDVWKGTAAKLAARGKIAVYPVGGWWRDRAKLQRHSAKTRYSLTVSITSDEQNVNLYNEITNVISVSQSI